MSNLMQKRPLTSEDKIRTDGRKIFGRTDGRTENFRTAGRKIFGRTEKFRSDGNFSVGRMDGIV